MTDTVVHDKATVTEVFRHLDQVAVSMTKIGSHIDNKEIWLAP